MLRIIKGGPSVGRASTSKLTGGNKVDATRSGRAKARKLKQAVEECGSVADPMKAAEDLVTELGMGASTRGANELWALANAQSRLSRTQLAREYWAAVAEAAQDLGTALGDEDSSDWEAYRDALVSFWALAKVNLQKTQDPASFDEVFSAIDDICKLPVEQMHTRTAQWHQLSELASVQRTKDGWSASEQRVWDGLATLMNVCKQQDDHRQLRSPRLVPNGAGLRYREASLSADQKRRNFAESRDRTYDPTGKDGAKVMRHIKTVIDMVQAKRAELERSDTDS